MELELGDITNCFLPHLVDQIFENYRGQAENASPTKEQRGQLFYDLSRLLGEDLVERSLQLLDEYSFTYYYAKNNRSLCVVELYKGTEYFRLLPKINYCKCDFFRSYVLQLPGEVLCPDIPSGQVDTIAGWGEESRESYTCQHVLALRFHGLLQPTGPKTTEQVLNPEEFKQLRSFIFQD
ncbi:hypothetical protein KR009_011443 [Drosophila setifemur]|nr:hypothetical protein KR009_011443 [Drosophila setifemur]